MIGLQIDSQCSDLAMINFFLTQMMKFYALFLLLLGTLIPAQEVIKPLPRGADFFIGAHAEEMMQEPEARDGRVIIETPRPKVEVPLFYRTHLGVKADFRAEYLLETAEVEFTVIQGEASLFSVEILGPASLSKVEGDQVKSWSVRREGQARFLDLVPADVEVKSLTAKLVFRRKVSEFPKEFKLTTFGAAAASGFSATYLLSHAEGLEHQLLSAEGALTLKCGVGEDRLSAAGSAHLRAEVALSAVQALPLELRDLRLEGELLPEEGAMKFRLLAEAHVTSEEPVSVPILGGRAAPVAPVWSEAYQLKLTSEGYQMEFQKAGVHAIDLEFVTAIELVDGWKKVNFSVPSGVVVPIGLKGLAQTAVFEKASVVSPFQVAGGHRAFLPASGICQFSWRPERESSEGELCYTSEAMEEISVGAGLLEQATHLNIKTLQGALESLKIQLAGVGEVLAVEGENILSWQVTEKRVLEILLTRAVTKKAAFMIRSQAALAAFPVKSEPLRLTPLGGLRHSGHFRIYNRGAVRIELKNAAGLTQLSPRQYPEVAPLPKSPRQVFHYRYPAAQRSFQVAAERVKPEINVSQVLAYEFTETDRVLRADLELEIREAAIREWSFYGPADYSVVSVTGADVADYVISEAKEGRRRLKVIFRQEVIGRRLVKVHLEKNEAAQVGAWSLPGLSFPGDTSVGGEVGVSAVPGFRVSPEKVEGLAEMPLARLLKRGKNVQQAFRVKAENWSAEMRVTALKQNIQADTFHLYSLKEGRAYVSVLFNFFVTGAPVHEWRFKLPEGGEHIEVSGSDVRDHRLVEGALVVPLHRPVMGAYQLLVTYEQEAESSLRLAELAVQAVQRESGFVQVVSPGQVEMKAAVENSLQEIDPVELPKEYQLMSHSPTLGAWAYQRRPFRLEREISWLKRGDLESRVVEFAKLSSRISRDGGVVTLADFDVRVRSSRALELQVPADLQVDEVKVDGKVVTVREAGEMRLIPLEDSVGPHSPLRVSVRSSHAGEMEGEELNLLAPRVAGATQFTTRWEVKSDTGYQLRSVSSGTLQLLSPFLIGNGFSWIEEEALFRFSLLVFLWLGGSLLMRVRAGVAMLGLVLVGVAAVGAFYLAVQGVDREEVPPEVLVYAAPVKAADDPLGVTVVHFKEGKLSHGGSASGAFGLSLLLSVMAFRWRKHRGLLFSLAGGVFCFALLSLSGGAPWFFALLGVGISVLFFRGMKGALAAWRDFSGKNDGDGADDDGRDAGAKGGPSVGIVSLLMVGLMAVFVSGTAQAKASSIPEWKAGDSLTEEWDIRGQFLRAKGEFTLSGRAGERFLLLKEPATLTSFKGEGVKVITEGGDYLAVLTREGRYLVEFSYQLAIADATKELPLLTGMAAVRKLTVRYEESAWSIDSSSAIRKRVLNEEGSGAILSLAPEEDVRISLSPRERDVSTEVSRYYVEMDHLFIPGPGVVDGRHLVKVRPAQGLVGQLSFVVPTGFTVSEVRSELVGPWRFNPSTQILTVGLSLKQSEPFTIEVETQRALAELPAELSLSPMRVKGAAGEVGKLALAFGEEAQLESDEVEGMSLVNVRDFGDELLPRDRDGQATVSLQKAYRYAQEEAALKLKVAPVSPEVRVDSLQRLSLGEERVVLAAELAVEITRAGIFRLSFPLPSGYEVESLRGDALNHWTEVGEAPQRMVVMHLNGKTMGSQKFSFVLNAASPKLEAESWQVPKISLREARREVGRLLIIPSRGVQLSVIQRKDLSALDPRELGAMQVGTLAFRLLQGAWELGLKVDQLAPSLAAQSLHDVELREGRSKSRIDLSLEVDYASIRELEMTLPSLSELDSQTVRVSGAEVRDILHSGGNQWKIRFKRRVIGKVPLRVEYEQSENQAIFHTAVFPELRQQESYLAFRPGARLKLDPLHRSVWTEADWNSLPKALYQVDRRRAPALFIRTKQPSVGVPISWKEHEVAAAASVRVTGGSLHTVLSSHGEVVSQVELRLECRQRGSLLLNLPPESRLFGVFVNEENALVVKDGDSFRFHVRADAGGSEASVKFTYVTSLSDKSLSKLTLKAFKIGEPLENVIWTVSLPEGYSLRGVEGDLDLEDILKAGERGQGGYRHLVEQRSGEKKRASLKRLDKASAFLKAGEQTKANQTLVQVYNQSNLDAASHEDVRVKVENLAKQQAVMGLNTRRQRLYHENVWDEGRADKSQIAAATRANPIFSGELNFGNEDYVNTINGNDAEVNRQLDRIAAKWVRNQRLTTAVRPQIDPVILPSGELLVFSRKMQINGNDALELRLAVENEQDQASVLERSWILLLIGVSLFLLWKFRK